jgi:hypothetical protein
VIDWTARAALLLAERAAAPTDKTYETRVLSVSSVGGQGVSREIDSVTERIAGNQWEVRYLDGRVRITAFAPARPLKEVRRRYPDAVAYVETASTVAACVRCVHASAYLSCGIPERAGLSERFMLVKHPTGGVGCLMFEGAS